MSKDLDKIVNNIAKQTAEERGIEPEKANSEGANKSQHQSFSQRLQVSRSKRNQKHFEQMKKNPEMIQARKELRDEFLATHPCFADMSNEDLQREMIEHAASEEKVRKQKLRTHMETFSDCVIGVIITIMLLEIPMPTSMSNYATFISNVGIFFVSFIVIANFWLNHHKTFAVTEEITEGIIVEDFIFMGLLSLIPLLSRWTMVSPSWFSSLNYGVVVFLILIEQGLLNYNITRDHFKKMPKSFKFWKRIWASRLVFTLVINVVITLIATAFPFYGHWLFVIVPVANFLMQLFSRDQEHEWQNPEDEREVGVPYLK